MKTLYFDMVSGITEEAALGCLFQLGAAPDVFSGVVSDMLRVPVKLYVEKTVRGGIACGRLKIESGAADGRFADFRELKKMIIGAGVPEAVKSCAIKILSLLAEAEGSASGASIDDMRFNEAVSLNAVICCIGFAWGVNKLGIAKISASRPVFGRGAVKTPFGLMPLPSPAALKILRGVSIMREDAEGELTTAPAAAILKACVSEFSFSFHGQVGLDVYAVCASESDDVPGLVRALVFDDDKVENKDEVLLMKTNIDDMSGENFGFLLDTLMNAGALDVSYSPAYGKKNRPLYMLTAMLPKEKEKEIAKIIFRYSTTAGIRVQAVDRLVMGREMMKVNVEGEPVSVKRLYFDDIEKFCPEWDDCVKASRKIITTPTDVHCRATLLASKVKERDER